MNELELKVLIEKTIADFFANDDRDSLPDKELTKPLGKYCDHTVLRAYTKREKVVEFCKEAIEYGAAVVSVMPYNIKPVYEALKGSGVNTGVAVGFPLGSNMPQTKAFEAALAIDDGANEVDMVINIGALRDKDYWFVYNDIKGVVDAVKAKDASIPVKIVIETCYLDDAEKIAACVISREAGADYVKTSTGFGTDGAYVDDIKLMRKIVGDTMLIKASTNVTTQAEALAMIAAGADRVGISRVKQIVTGDNDAPSASTTNKPPKYR